MAAFLSSRLARYKLKALVSLQSKARLCFGSPKDGGSPPLWVYASKTLVPSLGKNPPPTATATRDFFIGKPAAFPGGVRFFAASAQVSKRPMMNEKIVFPRVRLVSGDGSDHFEVPTSEALRRAKSLDLDLVVVQVDADPPVCKIFDYNKERSKQKAKEKERKKSKEVLRSDSKEVRFCAKTELKDLKMKAAAIKRFMEDGYRVKCVAKLSKHKRRPSGNGEDEEREEIEALEALIDSLIQMIVDEAIVECGPVVKNGQAHIIVRHIKFGPSKKGGAKKLKDVEENTPEDVTFSNGDDQQGGSPENDCRGQRSRPIQPEPHAAENRFRVESRNQFSRANGDSPGLQPQFPTEREHYPSNSNHSMDLSAFGGFNQPPPNRSFRQQPYVPQPPSGAGVHQPPPNRTFKQDPLPPPYPPRGSSSPTPGYGVFSPPSTGIPGGQGIAAESNRYARKPNVPSFSNPSDSSPGGQGVAAESNRYARKPNVPSFSNPSESIPGGQGVAAESNRYARKPNVPSFSPPSASIPGGQGVAAEINRYARKPNASSSNLDGREAGP